MYRTNFVVKGMGHFPLDMLRYDACCPSDHNAVDHLSYAVPQEREVQLFQYHPRKTHHITPDRWRSFGWVVVRVHPTVKVS